MTEDNTDKQLTSEYFGECADQVEGQLPVISKQVLGNRINLSEAQMKGPFVVARYYERLVEGEESIYHQLVGIEACLRLVANNEDPRPLIEKLLAEAREIENPKEHNASEEDRDKELEFLVTPMKFIDDIVNMRKLIKEPEEQK